ncbi:unnamed protein product [Linum trigynum]|uniref:Uncharacterized protein n=1 Tax=Linum trigynum TaxID=586398 RepID=A0AAV2F2L3_9ROSI
MQKARATSINHGDKNNTYFHTVALTRRRRNKVTKLQGSDGTWVEDSQVLEDMARDFYIHLFTEDVATRPRVAAKFPALEENLTRSMAAISTLDETRRIIKAMGGLKAPGKDDFHAIFYQNC